MQVINFEGNSKFVLDELARQKLIQKPFLIGSCWKNISALKSCIPSERFEEKEKERERERERERQRETETERDRETEANTRAPINLP